MRFGLGRGLDGREFGSCGKDIEKSGKDPVRLSPGRVFEWVVLGSTACKESEIKGAEGAKLPGEDATMAGEPSRGSEGAGALETVEEGIAVGWAPK